MVGLGVDINDNYPKNTNLFLDKTFDYVIAVCGNAKENCPNFIGKVKQRLHMGFEDTDVLTGTDEEISLEFIRIRNEILRDFFTFHQVKLQGKRIINLGFLTSKNYSTPL